MLARIQVCLLLYIGPGVAIACVDDACADNDPPVVELGDITVTRSELNKRFQVAVRVLAGKQGISLSAQDPTVIERLRLQYLDKYATELVMLQEAARRSIAVSSEDVDAAATEILAVLDDDEDFTAALQVAGIDGEEQLRQITRDEMTIQRLTDTMLNEIVVPAGDVFTLHHDVRDQLVTPEQVCVRHVQLATAEAGQEVLEELERGADFAKVASTRSTDQASTSTGGDLGCFEKGHSAGKSEFEKAAFAAPEGELVGPVKSDFGYHVIEVYEHKKPHMPTLNEAYDEIERELAMEQLPERIAALISNSTIKTYPENLAANVADD